MLSCYFYQEKHEDKNDLLQGALDIIDEFVEAFDKNANKNIMIILQKMSLLIFSGDHASEYQVALELYDLALNIHSRYLEDDKKPYADILLSKAINTYWSQHWKSDEEAFELLNKCLEIFYDDEVNNKEEIQQAHRYLAFLTDVDETTLSIDDKIMHGRKAIKLEREIHGEIRRNGQIGISNFIILLNLGSAICSKYSSDDFDYVYQKLIKEDFDEATEYLLETLNIAVANPDVPPLLVPETYFNLGLCECIKEEERNLRKALDYVEKGSLILSKIDKTDSVHETMSIQEQIIKLAKLSRVINEFMMYEENQ